MKRFVLTLSQLALAATSQALTLQLDYSHDAAHGNFFGTNEPARLALEAAAADLGAVLLPTLGAITTDIFAGSDGATVATFDWSLSFDHPVTGATVQLPVFTQTANVITIYAGMRPLLNSTLGEGGPAGAGVALSVVNVQPNRLKGAVAAAEDASNAVMPRGSGPVIGSLQGSVNAGAVSATYELQFGAIAGHLWFDSDTNNDGLVDSSEQLSASWHFDHTTPVAAGKNDFYSVALHELMHAIGFSSSDTWFELAVGSTWMGPAATALNGGSSSNLLAPGGDHLRSGLMSPRLLDGVLQEVAMDPTLTKGTRKFLTEMDAAFLSDLGYVLVPEPGSAALIAIGVLALVSRRSRRAAPTDGMSFPS